MDDYTYTAPRIEKFMETEERLELTKNWEEGKLLFNQYRVFWEDDEKALGIVTMI